MAKSFDEPPNKFGVERTLVSIALGIQLPLLLATWVLNFIWGKSVRPIALMLSTLALITVLTLAVSLIVRYLQQPLVKEK